MDEASLTDASSAGEEKARRGRRWSEEEKRAAVDLSLEPGANVKEVAACFGVSPSQIYTWRSELREDRPCGEPALFLPAVIESASDVVAAPRSGRPSIAEERIAIVMEIGGACVAIAHGAEPALATAIISALQATR